MRIVNLFILVSSALLLSSCGGDTQPASNTEQPLTQSSVQVLQASATPANPPSSTPVNTNLGSLDANEEAGLILMREEEKLARDVYTTLYQIHGANIFNNIATSEQTHFEAMKTLLDRYELVDPVASDENGVFTNPDLQDLYNTLVSLGTSTVLDAFYAGATIEELDIYDISRLSSEVVGNADITQVYSNLLRGSRNHLRSFNKQIVASGGSYQPVYITQALYDAIVNSAMETGRQ